MALEHRYHSGLPTILKRKRKKKKKKRTKNVGRSLFDIHYFLWLSPINPISNAAFPIYASRIMEFVVRNFMKNGSLS